MTKAAAIFCAFCLAVLPLSAAATVTRGNSFLISPNPNPGQKFPLQGSCARNGINTAEPNIDLTRSTWSCTGLAQQMILIFYRDGPQECVYIDNLNNDDGERAFFVPLQTSDEWVAFSSNLPGGMRLRRGCMGVILSDPCGNRFALPNTPASDNPADVTRISTSQNYTADYACPITTAGGSLDIEGGCGEWKKVKESGECDAMTSILPIGPKGPIIPLNPGAPGNNGNGNNGGNPTTGTPGGVETPGPNIPLF